MNINNYNSNQKTPNFGALPISRYKMGKNDFVCIYRLERSDLPFLQRISDNMDTFLSNNNITDTSRREIFGECIDVAQKILSGTSDSLKKTRIFIAERNKKLCGIIVGNIPKKTKNDNIVYSSRRNMSKKETEIDWFMTWNPFKKEKIKNIGKVTLNEYLNSTKADGFRDVYLRSETPEYSFAESFYEKMGFERIGNKYQKFKRECDNVDITGALGDSYNEDFIIPMIIKRSGIDAKTNEISDKFKRKELVHSSTDLSSFIDL